MGEPGVEFDHTSIAVRDAPRWLGELRRGLGATPLVGEVLPEFRYVLCHLGDATGGTRLELMDAAPGGGSGFLRRFLDRHGESAHHLTFTVPDVEHTIAEVGRLGLSVVKTDLAHLPWRETFIPPDAVHGVVIQLADSSVGFPPTAELLATRERDPARLPGNREGRDPGWWDFAWEVPPGPVATLRSTTLRTTETGLSHRLFAGVLGAAARRADGGTEYRWPRGTLLVRPAAAGGVEHLTITGPAGAAFPVGRIPLIQEDI
ncbi:VOC family protein [Spongiactinospora sp. TRM90649]|uniref:VOC family protein n=1 Tax=Spongiactinospora sp. TRM90649 TaxID=3031114 RepID=UPI0023F8438C|nr:VOC family protein [Spongiactinospora sp. TRM90649]MDF5758293.1 VOC family protein [Spongiactinospora sp. TRM90649]